MKSVLAALIFATLFGATGQAGAPETKLLLFGGGVKPAPALSRFVNWAGKEKAKILVISWATQFPEESFQSIKEALLPLNPSSIDAAPIASEMGTQKVRFLDQLQNATAVFFTGGDQNRIMDVLADSIFLTALRKKYAGGTVFAGTSAGTAIMSALMIGEAPDPTVIDGSKVKTRAGLGLLAGVIVDQHFIKRYRQNRLFGLVLDNPTLLGVGVDEDAVLAIVNGRQAEAIGGRTMTVDALSREGDLLVHLIEPGQSYDLELRK